MHRRFIVVGILAAVVTTATADLNACGDKFLRVGRSARFRAYAALHPASILIYAPVNAKPGGLKELEDMLTRAGHTALAVKNGSSLSQTLANARFDLVIAEYADAGRVKAQLESIPSRPDVLPVLKNPTKAVAAEAAKSYQFLLRKGTMTNFDALVEIDHLMKHRAETTSTAAR